MHFSSLLVALVYLGFAAAAVMPVPPESTTIISSAAFPKQTTGNSPATGTLVGEVNRRSSSVADIRSSDSEGGKGGKGKDGEGGKGGKNGGDAMVRRDRSILDRDHRSVSTQTLTSTIGVSGLTPSALSTPGSIVVPGSTVVVSGSIGVSYTTPGGTVVPGSTVVPSSTQVAS